MFRIVLAEDDRFTRNGIASLINHSDDLDFEISGEAQDGEQALRLVRDTKPDVIITDINMPKLNGLDLIRHVKQESPEILIVIISGYNDFEYMRAAIRFGVNDYLLKPVLPSQISDTLKKVKKTIERRRKFLHNIEELKQRVQKSLPILRERFYNELVAGNLSEREIKEKSEYFKIDLKGELFSAAIIKIQNYIGVEDKEIRAEDLMQCFLFSVVKDLYGGHVKVHAFARNDYQIALIFCVCGLNRNCAFMQITGSTENLIASLRKYLGITGFAAIGRLYPAAIDLKNSYKEAKEAILYSFSPQRGAVVNFDDICLSGRKAQERPAELDEKIILHTKLCQREECGAEIRNLFDFYTANHVEDPDFIKIDVFEMIMLVFCNTNYIFEDSHTDGNSSYKSETYRNILRCETFDGLRTWTLSFFDDYISRIEQSRKSGRDTVIAKAKEMVELYYKEKDFALDDIASKLFISPNYLRQIFKQKTGESFVEYLTKVRMEKAAELLSDDSLKVQQISELVGYENQQYFAVRFKKYYNCTPSDFRKIHLPPRAGDKNSDLAFG